MAIEVNTTDNLQYEFHQVNGPCFQFRVRAPNDAHLALTTGPMESDQMYEIFLGGWSNSKSVIRRNRSKPDVVTVDTPGILNAGEFRGFWIRWYDNVITVGREGEAAAFMSHEDPGLFPIRFIGVCTGWGASGSWLLEEIRCGPQATPQATGMAANQAGWTPVQPGAGPGCWVPASNGSVPPGAMEGGFDGEQLFIARARHEGALIPGKLQPGHGVCYIPWGGAEHPHSDYEVLCSGSGHWMPISGGNIPSNAMPAGETETGEPLFIGRANHNGTVTVGKVQPSHGCCYIPFGGQELAYNDFELFVSN